MIVPVRCFTCGKVLADKWEAYVRLQQEQIDALRQRGDSAEATTAAAAAGAAPAVGVGVGVGADGAPATGAIMDRLGITKYCCRTVMMTLVDMSLII
jgi:DNA-directed RNA polymerase subunit N (RpoN/RPB10)